MSENLFVMDLQTILICLTVFILSAFLIYTISMVMMREKPFEEVMEEQKRKEEELLQNSPKVQKKEKKKKFKKGKGNEKTTEEKEEVLKEGKMVELEIDPEYIPETSDSGMASSPSKKSKSGKATLAKSILLNKEKKGPVSKEAPELFHRKNVPKDFVELNHGKDQHGKDQHHRRNEQKEVEVARVPTNDVATPFETAKPTELISQTTSVQHVKKDGGAKKKKARDTTGDESNQEATVEKVMTTKLGSTATAGEMINGCDDLSVKSFAKKNKSHDERHDVNEAENMTNEGDSIMVTLQMAHLNDTDIKSLVEVLLGKLSTVDAAKSMPSVDWTKKGHKADPVTVLRKQLEEKEKAFEEEQQKSFAGNAKIKELNQELMSDRQKYSGLAKMNEDQILEIKALKVRMHETHNQHLSEVNLFRSQLETKAKQTNEVLQRFQEENKKLQDVVSQSQHDKSNEDLKQKASFLDAALQQLSKQMNAADNAKKSAETKLKQREEYIYELESKLSESNDFKERLDEMHLSGETRMKSLSVELDRHATALRCAEDDKNNYFSQLKTKDNAIHELNQLLQKANSKVEEEFDKNQKQENEIYKLRSQILSDLSEKKETNEQQLLSQERDNLERNPTATHDVTHYDKIVAEKDDILIQVRSQLDEKLTEYDSISNELNSIKQSYTDVENEKKYLMTSIEEKEKRFTEKTQEQIKEIEQLKEQSNKLKSDVEAYAASDRNDDVQRIAIELEQKKSELESTKCENEDLRKDNAVLNQCRDECSELKSSLVSLSNQLQEKDARQVQSETQLLELHEKEAKWAENEAIVDRVNFLEAKLTESETELKELREREGETDRDDGARERLEKELEEAKKNLLESESQARGINDKFSDLEKHLLETEKELSDVRRNETDRERELLETKTANETMEKELAEAVVKVERLHEVNTLAVEREIQIMELKEKETELRKINERFGSLEELEGRLVKLNEYEARIDEENNDRKQAMQQIEDMRNELKMAEITNNDLLERNSELLKEIPKTKSLEEQNSSSFDEIERTKKELENKEQELQQLRSELSLIRSGNDELETDKTKLMEMSENLRQELLLKEKQNQEKLENDSKLSHEYENLVQDLNEMKETQSSLESEVDHYKSILSDTERILKQLENNVDTEEQKWQKKYQMANDEIERLKVEIVKFKDNKENEEMQRNLENRLEASETEKENALSELNELASS